MAFSTQVLPLLGVVVGGGMAFFSTGAVERSRWRRQQSIRWDERRLDAYVTYAASIKRNATAVAEVLASDGVLKTIKPVTRNAGLEELGAAEATRSAAFEGVSLLGDTSTIEAGSQLNREVWRMQAMARVNCQLEQKNGEKRSVRTGRLGRDFIARLETVWAYLPPSFLRRLLGSRKPTAVQVRTGYRRHCPHEDETPRALLSAMIECTHLGSTSRRFSA